MVLMLYTGHWRLTISPFREVLDLNLLAYSSFEPEFFRVS